jgi:hypothetical protein
MNQDRRAKIEKLVASIQEKLSELRDDANSLSELQAEEQECFDNLPEGLQNADRGQSMEALASALEDAISSLESSLDDVESNSEEVLSALEN